VAPVSSDFSNAADLRAGGAAGNKGHEAAMAALELADVIARVRQAP
jgi:6,7-dimethyl-8-ribityllumazine synthase